MQVIENMKYDLLSLVLAVLFIHPYHHCKTCHFATQGL